MIINQVRGRYAIPGVYPPVRPLGGQRGFDFDAFSNSSGVNYAKLVLEERVENSDSNAMYVHKRIRITRKDEPDVDLNDQLTNLDGNGLKVTSANEHFWKVELLHPEIVKLLNPPQAVQELDNDPSLKIYKKYGKKKTGYSPHRWPAHERDKVNGFRHPESLSEERLQVYVRCVIFHWISCFMIQSNFSI